MKYKFVERDISWLSFNERVFQEATDKTTPLIERIKFLGIFSNNLDEFFRVRVATLNRLNEQKKISKVIKGENLSKLLKQIRKTVLEQQKKVEETFSAMVKELAENKIFIVDEKELKGDQQVFVRKYFMEHVLPTLAPIMIDTAPTFPYLNDKAIYFAVKLSKKNKGTKEVKYALIQIPTLLLPRFIMLPRIGESRFIILLDDVIRFCLKEVFPVFDIDTAKAYTIKLTLDAELDIDQDFSKSIVENIQKSIKQRKWGSPVRFVYDSAIPKDLLQFIIKKLKMRKSINLIPGGRYHNFKDFIHFPSAGLHDLLYHTPPPMLHPDLNKSRSILNAVRKKDVLLCFPYHSFNHITDLLREASIDPKVVSIKITLYRLAENSNIIYTLANAIKNGKSVTVVVELKARFDEEANIYWANNLKEEGAEVIYGISGLKVHSKLLLITRKEGDEMAHYGLAGTGNFNEDTAKSYSDFTLLTSNKKITNEIIKIFNFYVNNFYIGNYKNLLVSPFNMRNKLSKFISREIKYKKTGKPAYIILKLNSLVDFDLVRKLYLACEAGVDVKLIIRGSCAFVPGIEKYSADVTAISIVDKYLEHARVLVFCNGGDERIYITSADWMYRNLDLRNEVAVPVYDKKIRKQLKDLLAIQFSDNCKARIIDTKQSNEYKKPLPGEKRIRAQEEIYTYLKNQH
jgi:polyphosphate kinase